MREIVIDGKKIGANFKPYVVAELSANHNGSIERAFRTIEMASRMGASAVKLQTYTADTMTIDCDAEDFMISGGLWDGYKLYDLYKEAYTPYEWHEKLFEKGKALGITVFSTPFDETAVELLEDLDAPAFKIASFEAIDLPLIKRVAQTGKPMIISTGMATLEEISEAVATARGHGCSELVLLHCISSYPAPIDQSNLATIQDIAARFDCVAGLSDHTLGTAVSVAAVAVGACVIEKHVTLSREEKGPDSEFSLEPDELRTLCTDTETAWQAMGNISYERQQAEEANLSFRRSVYFVSDMKAGDVIKPNHIRKIRPGLGLAPKYYEQVLGKKVIANVKRGTAVEWRFIE
ncbi:MAG: pseudaminic acid synthase [bacterium]